MSGVSADPSAFGPENRNAASVVSEQFRFGSPEVFEERRLRDVQLRRQRRRAHLAGPGVVAAAAGQFYTSRWRSESASVRNMPPPSSGAVMSSTSMSAFRSARISSTLVDRLARLVDEHGPALAAALHPNRLVGDEPAGDEGVVDGVPEVVADDDTAGRAPRDPDVAVVVVGLPHRLGQWGLADGCEQVVHLLDRVGVGGETPVGEAVYLVDAVTEQAAARLRGHLERPAVGVPDVETDANALRTLSCHSLAWKGARRAKRNPT